MSSHIKERLRVDEETKKTLKQIAKAIRAVSMDAVEKANSGHPGLPMGCAEIGAYLFGVALNYNPKNPKWPNRDRFFLSAGHGSMLLYSCLHFAGYDISMDDIKNFRTLHSKTPGHPESMETPGVETTTGPLGQGFANGVGTALGLKILEAKFNTEKHQIFDSKVYILMSDGDIMEGISSEASSLAGHLQLNNVIAIYDANHISLDGPLSQACSENTKMRYEAYGWDAYEINGNNLDEVSEAISAACQNQKRPVLIIARTIIGKGAPNKQGTHEAHGSPLGEEELKKAKENLDIPLEPKFYVPDIVFEFFKNKAKEGEQYEKQWTETYEAWSKENRELAEEFKQMKSYALPADLEEQLWHLEIKSPNATRSSSGAVIQKLAEQLPFLIGGSADLSGSDKTMIKDSELIERSNFKGRNIKFGVREFCMASMATGISETGLLLPFVGTFLTFSDYMRNAIRLASLMKVRVIYHFTHDSIFLGEDGPTHQPIEHLASLRAMPGIQVIRPADSHEVRMAWIAALKRKGPTALILSRQKLPDLSETRVPYEEGVGRGAYVLRECDNASFTLIATGSEVNLAMDTAKALEEKGKKTRVVSMPCQEIFNSQNLEYRKKVLGKSGRRVSIEAAASFGWHQYTGEEGIAIAIDRFGASAPAKDIAEEFGFTVDAILKKLL